MTDPNIDFDRIAADRAEIEANHPGLFARIAAILDASDPMGIAIGDDSGNYDNEATTILTRLPIAIAASEVETILEQEMSFWFGDGVIHPEEGYESLAKEVWKAWGER